MLTNSVHLQEISIQNYKVSYRIINGLHPRVKSIPVCGCALLTSTGLDDAGQMPGDGEEEV